jgi:hypothetical protein
LDAEKVTSGVLTHAFEHSHVLLPQEPQVFLGWPIQRGPIQRGRNPLFGGPRKVTRSNGAVPPGWVKISRSGNSFSAYTSGGDQIRIFGFETYIPGVISLFP